MRVLWVCNIMLPVIAQHLNREGDNKEGWLTGLAQSVLEKQEENGIVLGVCFPGGKELAGWKDTVCAQVKGRHVLMKAYAFEENTARAEQYDPALEGRLSGIFQDFQPDLIHVFGTEYAHALASVKVFEHKEHILAGLQGLCFALAEAYTRGLPQEVSRRFLFRDLLKWDNIRLQQKKFEKRGEHEKETLRRLKHVTGRTAWDMRQVKAVNEELHYHFMNETLRSNFYQGEWSLTKCRPHSIFLSQGDYPIKGLHFVLRALPGIMTEFPDVHVYVAGQSIVRYQTLKEKLKISSYGKYLLTLIKELGLEERVTFLGRLDAEQMKEQYLKSHLFICPSILENSPNSLGEAMILGVPCIAARVGGIPSLFGEDDGILFEGGNIEELTAAVKDMWSDEKRMKGFCRHARARALCNHDADVNYHTLVQMYYNIMQE